jgi:hypothetical protein
VAHGALVDVEDAMKNNVLLFTFESITAKVDAGKKEFHHMKECD